MNNPKNFAILALFIVLSGASVASPPGPIRIDLGGRTNLFWFPWAIADTVSRLEISCPDRTQTLSIPKSIISNKDLSYLSREYAQGVRAVVQRMREQGKLGGWQSAQELKESLQDTLEQKWFALRLLRDIGFASYAGYAWRGAAKTYKECEYRLDGMAVTLLDFTLDSSWVEKRVVPSYGLQVNTFHRFPGGVPRFLIRSNATISGVEKESALDYCQITQDTTLLKCEHGFMGENWAKGRQVLRTGLHLFTGDTLWQTREVWMLPPAGYRTVAKPQLSIAQKDTLIELNAETFFGDSIAIDSTVFFLTQGNTDREWVQRGPPSQKVQTTLRGFGEGNVEASAMFYAYGSYYESRPTFLQLKFPPSFWSDSLTVQAGCCLGDSAYGKFQFRVPKFAGDTILLEAGSVRKSYPMLGQMDSVQVPLPFARTPLLELCWDYRGLRNCQMPVLPTTLPYIPADSTALVSLVGDSAWIEPNRVYSPWIQRIEVRILDKKKALQRSVLKTNTILLLPGDSLVSLVAFTHWGDSLLHPRKLSPDRAMVESARHCRVEPQVGARLLWLPDSLVLAKAPAVQWRFLDREGSLAHVSGLIEVNSDSVMVPALSAMEGKWWRWRLMLEGAMQGRCERLVYLPRQNLPVPQNVLWRADTLSWQYPPGDWPELARFRVIRECQNRSTASPQRDTLWAGAAQRQVHSPVPSQELCTQRVDALHAFSPRVFSSPLSTTLGSP